MRRKHEENKQKAKLNNTRKKTVKYNVVYLESGVKREYKSFQFSGGLFFLFLSIFFFVDEKKKKNENSLHLRYHGNGNSSFL